VQWFKHLTYAMDDPLIDEIIDRFGGDGYMMFFGILEVYAKEFKPYPDWCLTINIGFLKKRMRLYHLKKLLKFLDFMAIKPQGKALDATEIRERLSKDGGQSFDNLCSIYQRWCLNLNDALLTLYIPNFVKILDNHSSRQVQKYDANYVVTTKPLRLETDLETDIDKRTAVAAKCDIPQCGTNSGQPKNGRFDLEFNQIFFSLSELKNRVPDFRGSIFVLEKLKQRHHPAAIAHCLSFVSKTKDIRNIWGYANAILKTTHNRFDVSCIDFDYISRLYGNFLAN